MSSFQRLAVWTTATTYVLILVGGLVRASGAGLGCPDWPRCFGSWIPPASAEELPAPFDASQFNPTLMWTEYLNRLLGVTVGFLIFATLVSAIRHHRRVAGILWPTVAAFLLTGFQGWLGGRRRRARAGGVDRDGAPDRRAGDRVAARVCDVLRVLSDRREWGGAPTAADRCPGAAASRLADRGGDCGDAGAGRARRAGPRAGGRCARRGDAADGGAGHGRRLRPLASGYRAVVVGGTVLLLLLVVTQAGVPRTVARVAYVTAGFVGLQVAIGLAMAYSRPDTCPAGRASKHVESGSRLTDSLVSPGSLASLVRSSTPI